MMPFARMEAANSCSPSELNTVRGCMGLGLIRLSGSVPGFVALAGAAAAAVGAAGWLRPGRRADRPLPSALRCLSLALLICKNLLGQSDIAFCTAGPGIVHQNGLAITRSLREANAAWYYGRKDLIVEEFSQI